MALIIRRLYEGFSCTFKDNNDPRMADYPLLGSPFPIVAIMGLYLMIVLKWLPEWMKDRKPYDLKRVLSIYNALQVITNLILFVLAIKSSYLRKEFSFICQPINYSLKDPDNMLLLKCTYGYYITKYFDLLDTVFFVLRKKNNQVTFLHVYHHAGMIAGVYVFAKFMSGSHPTLLGVINAGVHVFMYSYYFMTSYKPELIKKQIWWKKTITQVQLLQFGYLTIHFFIPTVYNPCKFPFILTILGLGQNVFMFILFFDFYLKTYCKRKPLESVNNLKLQKNID